MPDSPRSSLPLPMPSRGPDKSCEQWQLAFWHALDGELPQTDSEALAKHIQLCPACSESIQDAVAAHRICLEDAVKNALRVTGMAALSAAVPNANAIHEGTREARRMLILDRRVLLAAALLLLIFSIAGYRHFNPASSLDISKLGSLATIESQSGPVFVLTEFTDLKLLAQTGQALFGKQGLQVETGSRVKIRYRDGTAMELSSSQGPGRLWLHYSPNPATPNRTGFGKHLELETGTLDADVARQNEKGPMIIGTKLAEVVVLGTQFQLVATSGSTRLQVNVGHVRLTRLSDRKAVEVLTGEFTNASRDEELIVKPKP